MRNQRMKFIPIIELIIAIALIAAPPRTLTYQGKLTDDSGVAITGSRTITFKIWKDETSTASADSLWAEELSVPVTNGLFDVTLGESTPIDISFDEQYWIELTVGTETLTAREKLATVPYAHRAVYVDNIDDNWESSGDDISNTNSGNVGVGTSSPDPTAKIDVSSTESGLLIPRMTESERDAISSPATSLQIFNIDTQCFEIYDGVEWGEFWCGPPPTITICGEETEIVDVTNPATGKTWMDRNLGASRQAIASDDYKAYGALFQWGRASDGHECITWTTSTSGTPLYGTTSINSNTDNPGHSDFILEPDYPYDWRVPQNDDMWKEDGTGVNNPCPDGYRLPTEDEWADEIASWSSEDADGAFSSPLKLTVAGMRFWNVEGLMYPGIRGFYRSSTVYNHGARYLQFYTSASLPSSYRATGYSVRCIKCDD